MIALKVTNPKRVSALLGFRPKFVKSHVDCSEQKSTVQAELSFESKPGARSQKPVQLSVVEFVRESCIVRAGRLIFARVE